MRLIGATLATRAPSVVAKLTPYETRRCYLPMSDGAVVFGLGTARHGTASGWRRKSEGEKLCTARLYRGGYENTNLGRYYVIDFTRNILVSHHIEIEAYGRAI